MLRSEYAKQIIKELYGNHISYKKIYSFCGHHESRYYDDGTVFCGLFRSCIIPNNCDFVIKTGMTKVGQDQCEAEMTIYELAKKAGLQEYFARPLDVVIINNHKFYVFEKIDEVGDVEWNHKYLHEEDDYQLEDMAYYVYPKDLERLSNFMAENGINDMHSGNFGWKDGHAVISDYGGYSWNLRENAEAYI